MRRRPAVVLACSAVLVSGCTSFAAGSPSGSSSSAAPEAAVVATAAPAEGLTVVADEGATELSVSASRALFETSEVAVVARDGDDAGTLLAASAAAALGVPLLVEPGDGGAGEALTTEYGRLGTATVLAVGEAGAAADGSAAPDGGPDRVAVAADPAAVADATGIEWAETAETEADGSAAAVAELDPESPVALVLAAAEGAARSDGGTSLPEVARAEPLDEVTVLATGEPETVAGIATARAAGARVILTGGDTDPRGMPDVVAAMREQEPAAVVALGAGFAAEDGLDWKVATAATGVELPAGGQLLFPRSFMVALYGHPGTAALGLLGEQPLEASIERARKQAAPYEPLVDGTVVPAFEIIATIASSSAGPDGNYSAEAELDTLRPWVEAAGEAGVYVVLDLQPGRTDFLTQAKLYRDLLVMPHVGLALDPEWRLEPDQVHLRQIGSVDVEEVNRVVTWLADLTRQNALPQKLLVLHQFRLDMIAGRERVDLTRDELAVMVHADGQGGQRDKQATWRALRQTAPEGLLWGWKNFVDEDLPMLTPAQTVEQVDPLPRLISYQ